MEPGERTISIAELNPEIIPNTDKLKLEKHIYIYTYKY